MNTEQVHYVYITTHIKTGEYYIGRRSTLKDRKQNPESDGYFGSGVWVKSITDKSLLLKNVIGVYTDFNEASRVEHDLIILHKSNLLCKNLKSISSSGIYGNKFSDGHKQKLSIAQMGENNPMWNKEFTKEHRQKMSDNSRDQSGEKHNLAKLTNEQVVEIRGLLEENSLSQKAIGAMFNVNQTAISKIKLGKRWKHLS